MSYCSPVVCHPNYVKYNCPEVVTVVYTQPLCTDKQAIILEVIESNTGTTVARESGCWNGDRVFTFICPPLTTFGYHEVIPILQKDGREHKLPAFSICCSKCWQLYEHLQHLTCSNSLLHVCLVALRLCQSPEQTLDPYWDMMCQIALERCVMQPHTLNSMGFPGPKPADLPIRDLFGNMFGEQTLQQFLDKHKLIQALQTFNAVSVNTQDVDGYEDLDAMRIISIHPDVYDDTSCIIKHSKPKPTLASNHTFDPASKSMHDPTSNSTSVNYHRTVCPSPVYPQPQAGVAHLQLQAHSYTQTRSKKLPKVSPKPSQVQKKRLQPLSEGDYTPFVIGNEQAYKKLPTVTPKPSPVQKPLKTLREEDYTPFHFESKQGDKDSDGEEYLQMEVQPLQSTQNSAVSLRSTSAHGQSHCKVAPVTPPKPNTVMATQRNSKVPLQLPSAMSTQNSAISLRSTSAHGQSRCKVAPVTPPKPNTFMATQRNSKAPLQLPSAMTMPLLGMRRKGNAQK